ncbi:Ig-like domain-containing protein [Segatella bryantii]|uniref:fimbrillin family protein n=1 Tax=Segatella bryantii TaxID=77095 RepID=UPI001EDC3A72|nr:Ig-like domain-containing protein [Segatella bryantii]UKK74594.1 Ig-like domain-containing protein [Segatella bryantii]
MKATKYLSMAALALMGVLASCQSDDEAVSITRPNNSVSVNFSVGSLQGTTRSNAAATDDTQRQFNQGDQISVSTNDQEAVLFQCTSTENQTWTEAVSNKFLLWTQPMLTFSAYYPVTTGTSMTTFTMPADQSSEAKIALADYMTRQQNISRPEGGSDIQMQLERKMARVIVRISGFGSQYDDDEKTVSNVSIYSEASGIEDGNSTGSSTEIQPYAQGNGGQGSTYTALVVPGYGDSGARFIRLTDGEYNTLLVKGIPELEAGNSYTFNLVVGKNRIEVASVTVQDWATGEILAGGQAQEVSASVTAITLNKTETLLGVGNTETLSVSSVTPDNATDQTVTWSSDNPSVATVDASTGEVTGVAKGTANITATANDGSGVSATCAVKVSTLAAAFVNGAVIQVYFKWDGNIAGDYVQGTYNASYGSFEADKGGNNWSLDDEAVYRVVKSGNNITISAGRYDYEYEGMEWTFNAASDTYTYTSGLYVNEEPNDYGLISVTLNGIDITNQLTKQ